MAKWRDFPLNWVLPVDDAESLWQEYTRAREAVRDYGCHAEGCPAGIDEEKYNCKCGWWLEWDLILGG